MPNNTTKTKPTQVTSQTTTVIPEVISPAPTDKNSADREVEATSLVKSYVIFSMGISVVLIPLIDVVAHSAAVLKMIKEIAGIYDVPFEQERGKSIVAALCVGYGSMTLAGKAGKWIGTLMPGIGLAATLALRPAFTGALTYGIGTVFIRHFAAGDSFFDIDLENLKREVAAEVAGWKGNR